jgi:hypothetical protein
MIRIPTALCLMALGVAACDSEGIDRAPPTIVNNQPVTTQEPTATDPPTFNPVANDQSADQSNAAGNTETGVTNITPETAPEQQPSSDDTQDGGNAQDQSTSTDGQSGNNTSEAEDSQPISDDAASSTSDGGQSANSDSDADQSSDDSQTESADNGEAPNAEQISDDAGSGSADGGQTIADDMPSDDAEAQPSASADDQSAEPDRVTDAGNFQSDNTGGSVIRVSSLTADTQENICTVASNQSNFSDTQVGDFILHNNAWRPFRAFPGYEWEQCIYTNTNGAVAGWSYDWGPGQTGINGSTSPSGDFYVRSYPELIYGVKDEYRTSAPKSVTGLPVELSDLPNISIDYSFNAPEYGEPRTVDASNNPRFPNGTTISGERNIAIESFFYNKDAAGQCSEGIVTRNGGSNHTYEIMVWLDAGAERLPAGPADFVTDLTIRDAPYKVYTKGSDPRYVAFVAQNPQSSGTVYWNDFVDWAKDNAHRVQERFGARSNSVPIQDDWCVANILVGTEIFWGAGNLDIYNWTITQSE